MNIYFKKEEDNFTSLDIYIAYLGFKQTQHKLHFYSNITELKIDKSNMIVSNISDTIYYLTKLGIPVPAPLNIPYSLNNEFYLKRNIEIKTLHEFYDTWNGECPIFIKPYDKVKLFAGGVIRKASSKDFFKEFPDDTKILISNYIDMSSEYRCFVNRGKLVGMKHYNSDFRLFPDMKIIDKAIFEYKNAPISYSIDFAVSENNETILIEANDGWSLGCYGLDAETYSKFLIDRWIELTK